MDTPSDDEQARDARRLAFLGRLLRLSARNAPAAEVATAIAREVPALVDDLLAHPGTFQRLLLAEPGSLPYDEAAKLHAQTVVLWPGITSGYLARPPGR
jgi:hypothetical protein